MWNYLRIFFLALLVLMVAGEIVVRLIGYKPYEFKPREWNVKPKNFFIYDSLLGYRLDTGVYSYSAKEKPYKSTHNLLGERITSFNENIVADSGKRVISFLGGTNVYGLEMSDEETLPFLFQKMFPAFKVRNLAVPEYGMAANYVLLTKDNAIRKGDIFVCIYFSAHDSRPPRKLLKAIYASVKSNTLESFPTLSIDESMKTRLNHYNYKLWPLNSYSALVNFAEDHYNLYADQISPAHEIAKKVMLAINDTCKAHGGTFVLVGRRGDDLTLKMLDFCTKNGIHATYLPMAGKSLLKNAEDRIRDKEIFAGKLMHYLREEKIIGLAEREMFCRQNSDMPTHHAFRSTKDQKI